MDEPPPVLDEDDGNLEQVLEWDRLNELAKSKIKFYITKNIYAIIWGGEALSALQLYQRLNEMFLGGDVSSAQVLEQALAQCVKRSNETLLQWWARLDAIFISTQNLRCYDYRRKMRTRKQKHCSYAERNLEHWQNY